MRITIDESVFHEIESERPPGWIGAPSTIGIFWCLYGLVRLIQPRRVVELGTCEGDASCFLMRAVVHNGGEGKFVGYELDPQLAAVSRKKLHRAFGDTNRYEILCETALDPTHPIHADFVFLDISSKRAYVDAYRNVNFGKAEATLCAHDLYWRCEREEVLKLQRVLEDEGWEVIGFPQERGLLVARKAL